MKYKLTDEELKDFEKIREVNAQVAEIVLGFKVFRNKKGGWSLGEADWYDDQGCLMLFNPLPNYMENIEAAWEVVNFLAPKGTQVRFSNKAQGNSGWWCYMDLFQEESGPSLESTAQGSTIMEAICKSALQLYGVKV